MLRTPILFGTAILLSLPLGAGAQENAAPAQQPSQSSGQSNAGDQQKKSDKQDKKKPAAAANPFPEAQSEKAAQQDQQQKPDAPSAPQPSAEKNQAAPAKPSTADANPFPEAESEKAARQQQQEEQPQPEPGAGDGNYSSSQVHMKGMELAPNADDGSVPVQAGSPLPYDPKLAKKDAQVGDFYLETGDFRGAYDRFVEAARSDPGNAEAVWGLAESAHHLEMNDVAIKNYRLYLAALPNGPHAKEIRKTLKGMGLDPGP